MSPRSPSFDHGQIVANKGFEPLVGEVLIVTRKNTLHPSFDHWFHRPPICGLFANRTAICFTTNAALCSLMPRA